MNILSSNSANPGPSAARGVKVTNSRSNGLGILLIVAGFLAVVCCALPRIPQPQSYHLFADQRGAFGIPHFGDVLSNLPFALVGVWGLVFLQRTSVNTDAKRYFDAREIWPYRFAFVGLLLTAFGSSYYHLAPDNARLVWDRLPMTITFMSMVAAIIAERVSPRLGLWLLPVLLAVGAASVLQWYWSETRGQGDLRFYAAVQVYAGVVTLLALFMPGRYTGRSYFGFSFGFYALAKALEFFDTSIFTTLQVVSGHTLKHLAAAAAGFCILRMLERRTRVNPFPSTKPASTSLVAVLCSNEAQQS